MGSSRANVAVLAAITLLTGCSESNFTSFDIVDVFRQNPPDEVDVLLVVDDSCSMQPYQDALGSNFNQFISWFQEADVDYQIGVITTDTERPDAGRIMDPIITPETPNAQGEFSRLVNVGIQGSPFEKGLESASIALTDLGDTANAGFLRDEASLSIIMVSDEQDSSPLGVNDYINEFYDIKGARNRDIFNASALVAIDLAQCGDSGSTTGTRYVDVARQTNGVVADMCVAVNQGGFEDIVFDLSLTTSRLRNVYFLSEEPVLSSLQVSVEDEIVPCESGRYDFQWVMDDSLGEERPAIVFDTADMPPVGAQIAARYFDGTADPLDFCAGGSTDDASGEE